MALGVAALVAWVTVVVVLIVVAISVEDVVVGRVVVDAVAARTIATVLLLPLASTLLNPRRQWLVERLEGDVGAWSPSRTP